MTRNKNIGFVPDFHIFPHLNAHLQILSLVKDNIDSELFMVPELFLPFQVAEYNSLEILSSRVQNLSIDSFLAQFDFLSKEWSINTPSYESLCDSVSLGCSIASRSTGPRDSIIISGLDFANAPLFDMALTCKCSKADIYESDSLLGSYRTMLASYIACFYLFSEFIANRGGEFISITAYNDYGPMSAARRVAMLNAMRYTMVTGSIVGGRDDQRVILFSQPEIEHKKKKHEYYSQIESKWYRYANPETLSFGLRDIEAKLSGASIQCYSPKVADDGMYELNALAEQLDTTKTVISLYTSSNDEANAISDWLDFYGISYQANSNRFADQSDWLANWIHGVNPAKIQFILRIHPRVGADHRGLARSFDYSNWLRIAEEFRSHGHIVVLPESRISSYILPYLSDYNVTSWSSIGQDLALMGFRASQVFSQPRGILNYPSNSLFLPYIPEISSYSCIDRNPRSFQMLDAIGSAATFYGWYRGLTTYKINCDSGKNERSRIASEISSVIFDGKMPEDFHYLRLIEASDCRLPDSLVTASSCYKHLAGYLRLLLRHALYFNKIFGGSSLLGIQASQMMSLAITARISALDEAIQLVNFGS